MKAFTLIPLFPLLLCAFGRTLGGENSQDNGKEALVSSTDLCHNGGVKSILVCPDGKTAISAGFRDHALRQWDLATGKQLNCLSGHDNAVFCLSISADGSKAISGDWNGQIRLWELKTGASSVLVNKNNIWTECIAFNNDGDHVALGSVEGDLVIRECKTGNCVQQFYGHESSIKSVAYSSDGKQLLSGGLDETIRLWNVKTGKMVKTIKSKSGNVYFVAFMADARKAVYRADRVHLIDLESGEQERCFGDADTTAAFSESALSPDSKLIAAVQDDHSVRVWETATGVEKHHLSRSSAHAGPLTSLAFSSDNSYLLSSDLNGDTTLCIWKLTNK
jgi:WD40 repeat protein